MIVPIGTSSNAMGLGAKITLEAGDFANEVTQSRQLYAHGDGVGASAPMVHFGLGANQRVSRLIIQWPSGDETRLGPIDSNQAVEIVEGRGLEAMLSNLNGVRSTAPLVDYQTLYQNDGVDAVITTLQSTEVIDPDMMVGLISWLEQLTSNRFSDAESILTALTEQRPDLAKPSFLLAEGLRRQGRMLEAIAFYRQALDRLPNDDHISSGEKVYVKTMAGRFAR